jgi:hypothetical protein
VEVVLVAMQQHQAQDQHLVQQELQTLVVVQVVETIHLVVTQRAAMVDRAL